MSPSPAGQAQQDAAAAAGDGLSELLREICETPAPTFEEERRAQLIARYIEEAGLSPRLDAAGNVLVDLQGGKGPHLVIAAHLDTVFPSETDTRVRIEGDRWSAPGVGDNSASLAVMIHKLRTTWLKDDSRRPRLTLAATVGEEGLGDLRGVRELFAGDHPFDLMIALDGHLGSVVHQAVGSRRFVVEVSARGGHSWGDYPSPSAVHAVADMVRSLANMNVPADPRSSYNVGQLWGGTGVNAIAQSAGFNLDLRSVDPDVLESLAGEMRTRVKRAAKRHDVDFEIEKVGDRPASAGSANEALTAHAKAALSSVGVAARLAASSTDANIPMSQGVPAISFGVYRGGDAHRTSEWLSRSSLDDGCRALDNLLERLTEFEPRPAG